MKKFYEMYVDMRLKGLCCVTLKKDDYIELLCKLPTNEKFKISGTTGEHVAVMGYPFFLDMERK